jgi:hypothetical protein
MVTASVGHMPWMMFRCTVAPSCVLIRPAQRALVVNGHNQLLIRSKLAKEIGSNFQDLFGRGILQKKIVICFNLCRGKKGVEPIFPHLGNRGPIVFLVRAKPVFITNA